MIIPIRALRLRHSTAQTWRINVVRNIASIGEHLTWAYDGLMQDSSTGSWPSFTDARFWYAWPGVKVRGKDSNTGERGLTIDPYLLGTVGAGRNTIVNADGALETESARLAGVDLTYPITDTISLVGTLAPDFSNVETDQQIIAPQEFPVQYVEYRPFFAQGAPYLNPNYAQFAPGSSVATNQTFYSPSIGTFNRGLKIEGAQNRASFAILNVSGFNQQQDQPFDDTAFGYKFAQPDRTFQYWADGVFANHGEIGDDNTIEAGANGRNLNNGFVWAVDHAAEDGSFVPNRAAQSTYGFLDVHKPSYEVNVAYADISAGYNPIDGYTAGSDMHGLSAFGAIYATAPWIKSYTLYLGQDRLFDRSGAVHLADTDGLVTATFKSGISIDNGGIMVSELRSYAVDDTINDELACNDPALQRTSFTGFPVYRCGKSSTYNLFTVPLGYLDGTPTPVDVSVSAGHYGTQLVGQNDPGQDYVHLYTASTSRSIGSINLGIEYNATYERALLTDAFDSQFLRRISIGQQLDRNTNFSVALRTINGIGGFAVPGTNFAVTFHRVFKRSSELFVDFGTPAAVSTLDRFIVKYVLHFGPDIKS